jgi:hypothetical protein
MPRGPAIEHDAEQPSLAVCARLETIKMPPGSQHRVLHQVLCDRRVASEAHGGPKQRADMDQSELLELHFP